MDPPVKPWDGGDFVGGGSKDLGCGGSGMFRHDCLTMSDTYPQSPLSGLTGQSSFWAQGCAAGSPGQAVGWRCFVVGAGYE